MASSEVVMKTKPTESAIFLEAVAGDAAGDAVGEGLGGRRGSAGDGGDGVAGVVERDGQGAADGARADEADGG